MTTTCVTVSPTTGMAFLEAVCASSWRSALILLNGASMYEMLRLLDQIDRADLADLLNARGDLNFSINVPRIEFAAAVVLDRRVPSTVPNDVLPQVPEARSFIVKRSPLRIPRDPTGSLPAPTPNQPGLAANDYAEAATQLGVETAVIHAVADVESGGRTGFSADGRPIIRYELHTFRKLTKDRYTKTHPHLSEPYTAGRGYHSGGQPNEWSMIYNAMMLRGCREYALSSASWGMFQIMGSNYRAAGYGSAGDFSGDTFYGARVHLDAFLSFCTRNGLVGYLKSKDWAGFASRYNGPAYKDNNYDGHLEAAYRRHGGT